MLEASDEATRHAERRGGRLLPRARPGAKPRARTGHVLCCCRRGRLNGRGTLAGGRGSASLYKTQPRDWKDHQVVKHFSVGGQLDYRVLFFVPRQAPHDQLVSKKDITPSRSTHNSTPTWTIATRYA